MAMPTNNSKTAAKLSASLSSSIRGALFDILAWMPYTDIVLTSTFGSWKDTLEDEDVAVEIKTYAEWGIARKMGRPAAKTPYRLSASEQQDPDTCIKRSLASIFQQVGKKVLSLWTYDWAEKKIGDKDYWEKLEGWIQKNLPHVETENPELLRWYIARAKRRQKWLQKQLAST
jgi:hypothetical protein